MIYTINPDGSGKSKVTNTYVAGDPIDYSPNGKKITYMSYEGFNDANPKRGPPKDYEIYTLNTDGTGQSRVTNNRTNESAPSYSPDGKRIVFSREFRKLVPPRTYTVEIYTIGVNGKNRVRLTHNATYDFAPDYSPDGRRIAFAGSRSSGGSAIYTISARGGAGKTKVTEGGDDPDYSPDGKKIVYYTGPLYPRTPDVYTINVGGGGKSKVAVGGPPSWGSRP